jgi:hypothetical protein
MGSPGRAPRHALLLVIAACAGTDAPARPRDVIALWVADRAATASTRLVDSLELRADGTGKWSRELYYRGAKSPEGTVWVDTAHRQFPPMALRWHVRGRDAERALCAFNVVQEDSTCAPIRMPSADTLIVGDLTYRRIAQARTRR